MRGFGAGALLDPCGAQRARGDAEAWAAHRITKPRGAWGALHND